MFVPGAVVEWNGQALQTTFLSQGRLTAVVPAADIATPQIARVTVANPGTAVVSNVALFDVTTPESNVYYKDAPGYPAGITSAGAPAEVTLSGVVGDLLDNGRQDLAYAAGSGPDPSDYGLAAILGNGDGTFTSLPFQPMDQIGIRGIAKGDFTGNGKLDMALTSVGNSTVTIMLNNGDGTFTQAGPPIPVGLKPFALVAGDFNRDGKLDLAVLNTGSDLSPGSVTVLLGNGDGTFTQAPGSPIPVPSDFVEPTAIAVGDYNGDGNLDLAISDGDVWVLLGNGDGTFRTAPGSPIVGVHGQIYSFAMASGDFNGDGKLDLAVTGLSQTSTLAVLLGNGDGTFTQVPNCCGVAGSLGAFLDVYDPNMTMGDFNGDGKLDLAILSNLQTFYPSNIVQIFLGQGDGKFAPTDYAVIMNGSDDGAINAGDFDGSGRLGMVVIGGAPQAMWSFVQIPQSQWAYPPGDFTISAQNSSLSVSPGGIVTDNIMVSSQYGFYGPVTVSCSGAPALASCTLAPPTQLMAPSENLLPTLTITTTSPFASSSSIGPAAPAARANRRTGALGAGLAGLALGLWAFLFRRKPACARAILLAAVLVSAGAWSSCGAAAPFQPGPKPPAGGTPPGTYVITVTASSPSGGGLSHSATITLTVEPVE